MSAGDPPLLLAWLTDGRKPKPLTASADAKSLGRTERTFSSRSHILTVRGVAEHVLSCVGYDALLTLATVCRAWARAVDRVPQWRRALDIEHVPFRVHLSAAVTHYLDAHPELQRWQAVNARGAPTPPADGSGGAEPYALLPTLFARFDCWNQWMTALREWCFDHAVPVRSGVWYTTAPHARLLTFFAQHTHQHRVRTLYRGFQRALTSSQALWPDTIASDARVTWWWPFSVRRAHHTSSAKPHGGSTTCHPMPPELYDEQCDLHSDLTMLSACDPHVNREMSVYLPQRMSRLAPDTVARLNAALAAANAWADTAASAPAAEPAAAAAASATMVGGPMNRPHQLRAALNDGDDSRAWVETLAAPLHAMATHALDDGVCVALADADVARLKRLAAVQDFKATAFAPLRLRLSADAYRRGGAAIDVERAGPPWHLPPTHDSYLLLREKKMAAAAPDHADVAAVAAARGGGDDADAKAHAEYVFVPQTEAEERGARMRIEPHEFKRMFVSLRRMLSGLVAADYRAQALAHERTRARATAIADDAKSIADWRAIGPVVRACVLLLLVLIPLRIDTALPGYTGRPGLALTRIQHVDLLFRAIVTIATVIAVALPIAVAVRHRLWWSLLCGWSLPCGTLWAYIPPRGQDTPRTVALTDVEQRAAARLRRAIHGVMCALGSLCAITFAWLLVSTPGAAFAVAEASAKSMMRDAPSEERTAALKVFFAARFEIVSHAANPFVMAGGVTLIVCAVLYVAERVATRCGRYGAALWPDVMSRDGYWLARRSVTWMDGYLVGRVVAIYAMLQVLWALTLARDVMRHHMVDADAHTAQTALLLAPTLFLTTVAAGIALGQLWRSARDVIVSPSDEDLRLLSTLWALLFLVLLCVAAEGWLQLPACVVALPLWLALRPSLARMSSAA